jgi:hypothetical protein
MLGVATMKTQPLRVRLCFRRLSLDHHQHTLFVFAHVVLKI